MSHRKLSSEGFTLVELLVVIMVIGVLFTAFADFFNNNMILFFDQQQNSMNLTELQNESQRIGDVLRGTYDIISASPNQLSVYAYFSPNDTYVSEIDYYLNSTGNQLMASITPMTANPPIGTPITNDTTIYTVISNYYAPAGINLFTYYDANNNILTPPIADERSIINIGINLAEPIYHSPTNQYQTLNLFINLRNRKNTA